MGLASWSDPGRVLVEGAAADATLALPRIPGERTPTMPDAYDLAATAALGSAPAAIARGRPARLAEGVLALALRALPRRALIRPAVGCRASARSPPWSTGIGAGAPTRWPHGAPRPA